jgi:hypothetical protein
VTHDDVGRGLDLAVEERLGQALDAHVNGQGEDGRRERESRRESAHEDEESAKHVASFREGNGAEATRQVF